MILAAGRRRGGGERDASPGGRQGEGQGAARPLAQKLSPRSQELADIVAPGGRPLGDRDRGATEDIRTLPGGLR